MHVMCVWIPRGCSPCPPLPPNLLQTVAGFTSQSVHVARNTVRHLKFPPVENVCMLFLTLLHTSFLPSISDTELKHLSTKAMALRTKSRLSSSNCFGDTEAFKSLPPINALMCTCCMLPIDSPCLQAFAACSSLCNSRMMVNVNDVFQVVSTCFYTWVKNVFHCSTLHSIAELCFWIFYPAEMNFWYWMAYPAEVWLVVC